jgi:PhnB protein
MMMFDAKEEWPETPTFLRIYVEDGNAAFERALQAGAKEMTKMTNMFFGERVGRVRDPLGNVWWLHQRIEDLDHEEMAKRSREAKYIVAMEYVQNS